MRAAVVAAVSEEVVAVAMAAVVMATVAVVEVTAPSEAPRSTCDERAMPPSRMICAEAIDGGALIGVRSQDAVAFYDWETGIFIRRIDVPSPPKAVYWNDAGDHCIIATREAFYSLRFDRDGYDENGLDKDGFAEQGMGRPMTGEAPKKEVKLTKAEQQKLVEEVIGKNCLALKQHVMADMAAGGRHMVQMMRTIIAVYGQPATKGNPF